MKVFVGANLALRFLLELAALAAVGYWGWQTGDGAVSWVLAIAAVAAVIAVWALFVSPKHTTRPRSGSRSRSSSRCGSRPALRYTRPAMVRLH